MKRAEEVVKDLNDAEEAQTKARVAIKQANEDIDLAKIDLEQVIMVSYKAGTFYGTSFSSFRLTTKQETPRQELAAQMNKFND